ncbi:hypothetical protein KKD61_00885 [Patescibacteria group bacterium]|nr:hypothetical protein [Patescibacteria group bacterium]
MNRLSKNKYLQKGLAQLPLILGLLLIGIALPAAINLLGQRQETRKEAAFAEPCKVCSGTGTSASCKTVASPPFCSATLNECEADQNCRLAATSTPKPAATSTPKPAATSTPRPTATSTPRPASTNTPTPTQSPCVSPNQCQEVTYCYSQGGSAVTGQCGGGSQVCCRFPTPAATSTPRPASTNTPTPRLCEGQYRPGDLYCIGNIVYKCLDTGSSGIYQNCGVAGCSSGACITPTPTPTATPTPTCGRWSGDSCCSDRPGSYYCRRGDLQCDTDLTCCVVSGASTVVNSAGDCCSKCINTANKQCITCATPTPTRAPTPTPHPCRTDDGRTGFCSGIFSVCPAGMFSAPSLPDCVGRGYCCVSPGAPTATPTLTRVPTPTLAPNECQHQGYKGFCALVCPSGYSAFFMNASCVFGDSCCVNLYATPTGTITPTRIPTPTITPTPTVRPTPTPTTRPGTPTPTPTLVCSPRGTAGRCGTLNCCGWEEVVDTYYDRCQCVDRIISPTPTPGYTCDTYCVSASQCRVPGVGTCPGSYICCDEPRISVTPTPTVRPTSTPTPTLSCLPNGSIGRCNTINCCGWADPIDAMGTCQCVGSVPTPTATPALGCYCVGPNCSTVITGSCQWQIGGGVGLVRCTGMCGAYPTVAPTPTGVLPTATPSLMATVTPTVTLRPTLTAAPTATIPPNPTSPPATPEPRCPYSSLQARVQLNSGSSWAQNLSLSRGRSVNLGCMYDNSGQIAERVKLVAEGPENREWGDSFVKGWTPSLNGGYRVYCVSTRSSCNNLNSGSNSAALTVGGCKPCPDGTYAELGTTSYNCQTNGAQLDDFIGWREQYLSSRVIPENQRYADYDCGGSVDIGDFILWRERYLSGGFVPTPTVRPTSAPTGQASPTPTRVVAPTSTPTPASGQVRVGVSPQTTTVNSGATVTININVTNVENLYGFSADVVYDATRLNYVSWGKGSFFEDSSGPFWVNPKVISGRVEQLAATRLNPAPPVSGSGTLFSLTFTATEAGSSSITIENISLLDNNANSIPAALGSGQIIIQ